MKPPKAWPSPDPRLPMNRKAHEQVTHAAKDLQGNMNPARASRLRRLSMEACMCRLCALTLRPPITFFEAALFQYGSADAHPPRQVEEPVLRRLHVVRDSEAA